MRKFAAIAVSVGLVAALSACAGGPATGSDCTDEGNAALVTADGTFGGDPEATFPFPLVSETVSVATVSDSDGPRVPRGGVIAGAISVYDGGSGEPVLDPGNGQPIAGLSLLMPTATGFQLPFTASLACASAGSRIAVEGPASDLFNESAVEGLGLTADQSIVVITDVEEVYLGRADGADQVAQSGLPAVVLAPNGQPGFTFPDAAAPAEQRVALLKRGSGAELADGDVAVVHYSALGWQADAVSASSWPTLVPARLALDGQDQQVSSTFVFAAAVKDALVGLPVGSQVLVAVPGDSPVVYVVDILGISEAQ